MKVDAATVGALLGFAGLVVTALCGVFVATRTNRSEKESTALKALEETREEAYEARLTLRDEQLAQAKADLERCKIDNKLHIEELENENDKLYAELKELKEAR